MHSNERSPVPALVVDLDGTLVLTDTLLESVLQLIRGSPADVLRLPLWLMQGRAKFKDIVAARTRLAVSQLPYRESLVAYLREEREKGRRVVLATAAHRTIADSVASHLGCFDDVLASSAARNLKGEDKLAAILDLVGGDFVYAGDSAADIPVWLGSRGAILADVDAAIAKKVRRETLIVREFSQGHSSLITWLKALRVYQWTKNLLLFVPLLTAFSFVEASKVLAALLAFLSFSLAASATYVVNDLVDLDADRHHPRKRHRPFASGALPIAHGVAVAGVALGIALALAGTVSWPFFFMLVTYVVLTSVYSTVLKRYVLIDVLALSVLYTWRILAGSVAINVHTTAWLLAFSVFLFFSLALVKRASELVSLVQLGKVATRGRDYRTSDLVIIWPTGVASAMCSVVIFGLFISAPETQIRYGAPGLLWLVSIGLIYWLGRIWLKTARGEMHHDPLVFAVVDRGSRITLLLMLGTTLMAYAWRMEALF